MPKSRRQRVDFRRTLWETLRRALGTHQRLSLRSLAFILASAIRRARALSSAALHRSPERISGRKIATKRPKNMATKRATKRADSMSVSYESLHFPGSDGTSPPLSSTKIQSALILGHYSNFQNGSVHCLVLDTPLPRLSAKSRKQTACFMTMC